MASTRLRSTVDCRGGATCGNGTRCGWGAGAAPEGIRPSANRNTAALRRARLIDPSIPTPLVCQVNRRHARRKEIRFPALHHVILALTLRRAKPDNAPLFWGIYGYRRLSPREGYRTPHCDLAPIQSASGEQAASRRAAAYRPGDQGT